MDPDIGTQLTELRREKENLRFLCSAISSNCKRDVEKAIHGIKDINAISDVMGDGAETTVLCKACTYGHSDIIDMLLEMGADPSIITPRPALCLLAKHKTVNLQTVQKLLEHQANVNAEDIESRTALYLACDNNNLELVKYLVQAGANVNAEDIEGRTPLYAACISYDTNCDMLEFLTDNGADPLVISPLRNNTTLHAAAGAMFADCDKIKHILNWKVEVNAKNRDNKTAIDRSLFILLHALNSFNIVSYSTAVEMLERIVAAVKLLVSAGANLTHEMSDHVKQAILTCEHLTLEHHEQVLGCLQSLQQPRSLVQLCCIEVRALLPAPVNSSALQLSEILPDRICKGIIDFSLE